MITADQILYSVDAHGDGHAAIPGNPHQLTWHHADSLVGDVTLDDHTRPCGLAFDEHTFHTFAESYFQVRHAAPAALLVWIERSKADAR